MQQSFALAHHIHPEIKSQHKKDSRQIETEQPVAGPFPVQDIAEGAHDEDSLKDDGGDNLLLQKGPTSWRGMPKNVSALSNNRLTR